MNIGKNIDCVKLAENVVSATRTKVLVTKTKMTRIADRCNYNRATVTRKLDEHDMTLSMWLASVAESEADPCRIISNAIREQSALADNSKEEK